MSIFVAWVVFPLVLAAVSIGCGLLLEQVAGRPLPGPLLVPAGLALVIVVAGFATLTEATAELATPGAVAAAAAGFALAWPWQARRVDWWAAAAAVGTFAVYAAPVVLSGSATFAGYITLDDTSTWLALVDRAMEEGRSLDGLAPSTYQAVLNDYLTQGTPLGALLPLGVGHELVRLDSAWLFQPSIAFFAAALSFALYGLISRLTESKPLSAFVAFVAAQPALLYAYALWSAVKESAAAVLIVLAVALLSWALADLKRSRELIPAAVAIAALMITLTVAGAIWLLGAVLATLALAVHRYGRKVAAPATVAVLLAVALAMPAIVVAGTFFRHVGASDVLTEETELGNLVEPLEALQLFGIWPAGDFRFPPDHPVPTYALIGTTIAAALVGLGWALLRRAWGVALYVGTAGLGCAIFVSRGSPWVDGKALVTASAAFLLAGLLGAVCLIQTRWRVAGFALAIAISGGVLWSNALAYHQVWLAPRAQLHELEVIGAEFAGDGPALMTEYVPYATRHFLRRLDPEGASERRSRPVLLRSGRSLERGEFVDIDQVALADLLVYRTLVLRRSPTGSRPPSVYGLVRPGRFYDVWQRPESPRRILEHVSLGGAYDAGSAVPCSQVRRLARAAWAVRGRLIAATSVPTIALELTRTALPSSWEPLPGSPALVTPSEAGSATAILSVPVGGTYGVWLGGSFRGRLEIIVDGRRAGVQRHRLNWSGQYSEIGTVSLLPGVHRIVLRYNNSDLRPGSGGVAFPIGPLLLRQSARPELLSFDPRSARRLCGRTLDWLEAVA